MIEDPSQKCISSQTVLRFGVHYLSSFITDKIKKTRQSKHCGFCIKINGQVGQGGEDGLDWSGLCQKDSKDDFDLEYIGFDGSPDD